mgnify:CR=1 FL=1
MPDDFFLLGKSLRPLVGNTLNGHIGEFYRRYLMSVYAHQQDKMLEEMTGCVLESEREINWSRRSFFVTQSENVCGKYDFVFFVIAKGKHDT